MATNDPVIIKKIKKYAAGHHGGAWKIAYADFVTAMMAFFLLMWLINMTSPEQKKGIAEYFSPPTVSDSKSGAGGVLGGASVTSRVGVTEGGTPSIQSAGTQNPDETEPNDNAGNTADRDMGFTGGPQAGNKTGGLQDSNKSGSAQDTGTGRGALLNAATAPGTISNNALQEAQARKEAESFKRTEAELRQALNQIPDLQELKNQLVIDQTPDGLRVQIVDQEGRSMFGAGNAEMPPRAKELLQTVAKVINKMPNRVSIAGHTDSSPFGKANGYSNWELSSDRANSARRVLQEGGMDPNRLYQVTGKADSEPLFPDNPSMAGNRRISIVLLRETPVVPPSFAPPPGK
jgi:chemotaxis protein MotB